MRVEIVSVGTELLLGQILDTNSTWIAERLAAHGVSCRYQTRVGDNVERIAGALRAGLARGEAVIACGGLGPTQDDLTREAIAKVMNVPLVRDPLLAENVRQRFAARKRAMPTSNLRQADLPRGASAIPQVTGTAPGLICPVGWKVIYALPGVPGEMREMVERAVLPDLVRRSGSAGIIASRTLRTWGTSESDLAEILADRVAELDEAIGATEERGTATLAFLASGIEGIKVRVTVAAEDGDAAASLLDTEEKRLRALLGDLVFGVDDESMEHAVAGHLTAAGRTMATAESLTGGLVAARLVNVPGASRWFRGSVVAYDSEVKFSLLGVRRGPVVSEEAAREMASGVCRTLGADIGLSLTGVAGPDPDEGHPPGTVIIGLAGLGSEVEAVSVQLPGERQTVRELAAITALDLVRRRLSRARSSTPTPVGR